MCEYIHRNTYIHMVVTSVRFPTTGTKGSLTTNKKVVSLRSPELTFRLHQFSCTWCNSTITYSTLAGLNHLSSTRIRVFLSTHLIVFYWFHLQPRHPRQLHRQTARLHLNLTVLGNLVVNGSPRKLAHILFFSCSERGQAWITLVTRGIRPHPVCKTVRRVIHHLRIDELQEGDVQ